MVDKITSWLAAFVAMFTAFALFCTNSFIAVASTAKTRTHQILIVLTRPDTVPKTPSWVILGPAANHPSRLGTNTRRRWTKISAYTIAMLAAVVVAPALIVIGAVAVPVALGISAGASITSFIGVYHFDTAWATITKIYTSAVWHAHLAVQAMIVVITRNIGVLGHTPLNTSFIRETAVGMTTDFSDDAVNPRSHTSRHQGASLVTQTLATIGDMTRTAVPQAHRMALTNGAT